MSFRDQFCLSLNWPRKVSWKKTNHMILPDFFSKQFFQEAFFLFFLSAKKITYSQLFSAIAASTFASPPSASICKCRSFWEAPHPLSRPWHSSSFARFSFDNTFVFHKKPMHCFNYYFDEACDLIVFFHAFLIHASSLFKKVSHPRKKRFFFNVFTFFHPSFCEVLKFEQTARGDDALDNLFDPNPTTSDGP